MDITALAFVALSTLRLGVVAERGNTDHPGLADWAQARAARKPQD